MPGIVESFLLFEVIAFGQVLDFSARLFRSAYACSLKNCSLQSCGNKGSAKQELFDILQYKQKIFVEQSRNIMETSRIFDAELCEHVFKISLFAVSPSSSPKITTKLTTALRCLDLILNPGFNTGLRTVTKFWGLLCERNRY